jgi:dTDP-4-dehydrorhamnose reductase
VVQVNRDISIIVVGCGGMLGREVVESLKIAGMNVEALGSSQIDITKKESVGLALTRINNPGLLINCAAYTAVDRAESEAETAFAVNRDGPAYLAEECQKLEIPLIHISTDYVFNGRSDRPYKEDDPADPINIYGLSKWQGEEAVRSRLSSHVMVRTSWLYGSKGWNFVKTMLKLGMEREELNVVSDQYGCPTWTFDLAGCLVRIAERALASPLEVQWGTYHYCGAGVTTWYQFASAILNEAVKKKSSRFAKVLPVPTSAYPTTAARPMYSALDCGKIKSVFGVEPPLWDSSLRSFVEELYRTDANC